MQTVRICSWSAGLLLPPSEVPSILPVADTLNTSALLEGNTGSYFIKEK